MRRLWLFFDYDQRREIRLGREHGLSDKEISVYAKHRYTSFQMSEIRLGLEQKLSRNQIKMYAKRKFWDGQMKEIREGFLMGLSKEQVKQYATDKYEFYEMRSIRYGLAYGMTMQEALYIEKTLYFGEALEFAYKNQISLETFRYWACEKCATLKGAQMEEVLLGVIHGLSEKEISQYSHYFYSPGQMRQIRLGLEHGLTEEEISVYSNSNISEPIMVTLREDIEEKHEDLT